MALAIASREAGSRNSKRNLRNFSVPFFESVFLRGEAIKLLLEECYFIVKIRVLCLERCNLLRQQQILFFQQIDYVLAQSGGRRNPNDFFCGVDGTHDGSGADTCNFTFTFVSPAVGFIGKR
jgi:hypothetical protein